MSGSFGLGWAGRGELGRAPSLSLSGKTRSDAGRNQKKAQRGEDDSPSKEANLVSLPVRALLVLEVVDGVPTRVGGQVRDKVVVGLRGGLLLD